MTVFLVEIQRWPVLGRDTETRVTPSPDLAAADPRQAALFGAAATAGEQVKTKLIRNGYQRTRECAERRTVRILSFASKTRVLIQFGTADTVYLSLTTGRMVGNADWLIAPEDLAPLRLIAKQRCP